jgi:hypothetical protein
LQSENETSGKIKLHIAEVLADHDKIGANKKRPVRHTYISANREHKRHPVES